MEFKLREVTPHVVRADIADISESARAVNVSIMHDSFRRRILDHEDRKRITEIRLVGAFDHSQLHACSLGLARGVAYLRDDMLFPKVKAYPCA